MLATNILRYGHAEPLPTSHALRAGPLSLVYEAGDLRYVRYNEHELLRRVYVAVRDHNWGTVVPYLSEQQIEDNGDSFRITFTATHQRDTIDFQWHGEITGTPDGMITFVMNGVARSDVRTNRTGFCVLHPDSCAGARARITHVDGMVEETAFPRLIAPQTIENGRTQPVEPFADMQALAHEVAPNIWVETRFFGDTFELEDQRNWTDGSFKTYCRPLRLPYPYLIPAGTQVQQTMSIQTSGLANQGSAVESHDSVIHFQHGAPTSPSFLPEIGFGAASHQQPLHEREIKRLQALGPAHLRVDLQLQNEGYLQDLERLTSEANSLQVPLEIAIFLSNKAETELLQLRETLQILTPTVKRWLVFHANEVVTAPGWVVLARKHLAEYTPDAPFVSGTNVYFTELNRNRPDSTQLDGITYSVNPQVHAFDNASLVETTATLAATIESAHAWSGNKPIHVSPVTLRPRFNAVATGPEATTAPNELPPQVDPRQMSLFGACWTLAAIKYLAESGVASTTFYETTGWRGVMETEAGSPLPTRFPSLPGAVFPLYHVLADVQEFAGATVIPSRSSNPLAVDGLVLQRGETTRILIANLSNTSQHVSISNLAFLVVVRTMNEHNALVAMQHPEAFRAEQGTRYATINGMLELELAPYAVARIDFINVQNPKS